MQEELIEEELKSLFVYEEVAEVVIRDSDGFGDFGAEFEDESREETEVCIPQEIIEAVLEGLHYNMAEEDIESIQAELTEAVVHAMEDNVSH